MRAKPNPNWTRDELNKLGQNLREFVTGYRKTI